MIAGLLISDWFVFLAAAASIAIALIGLFFLISALDRKPHPKSDIPAGWLVAPGEMTEDPERELADYRGRQNRKWIIQKPDNVRERKHYRT